MQPYGDLTNNSGITAYECGPDFIKVSFRNGTPYVYDYSEPGEAHVEEMKRLAHAGTGLATYINQHVRERFARRE